MILLVFYVFFQFVEGVAVAGFDLLLDVFEGDSIVLQFSLVRLAGAHVSHVGRHSGFEEGVGIVFLLIDCQHL